MKLADEISFNLQGFVSSSSGDVILPRLFLEGYEADLCKITKSLITYEYEVKISRSDFFNDFKKTSQSIQRTKHDKLKDGLHPCNFFFFVVPEGLISVDEVPTHCGLIYYKGKTRQFETVKFAPKIRKTKYFDEKKNLQSLLTTVTARWTANQSMRRYNTRQNLIKKTNQQNERSKSECQKKVV